jgi:5'(3')-deoxyribonucleotidase
VRPRLGLDLDGVVVDWVTCVNDLLREHFGYEVGPWERWDHAKRLVAPEHWAWLWTEGVEGGMFRHADAYPGAAVAVTRLCAIARVVVVSKVPPGGICDRLSWLGARSWPIKEAHLLNEATPKSSVDCDIYLDDSLENVEDLVDNAFGDVLVWDQPWNRGELPRASLASGRIIQRVETWAEVERAVRARGAR